jgi:hypothetical protein
MRCCSAAATTALTASTRPHALFSPYCRVIKLYCAPRQPPVACSNCNKSQPIRVHPIIRCVSGDVRGYPSRAAGRARRSRPAAHARTRACAHARTRTHTHRSTHTRTHTHARARTHSRTRVGSRAADSSPHLPAPWAQRSAAVQPRAHSAPPWVRRLALPSVFPCRCRPQRTPRHARTAPAPQHSTAKRRCEARTRVRVRARGGTGFRCVRGGTAGCVGESNASALHAHAPRTRLTRARHRASHLLRVGDEGFSALDWDAAAYPYVRARTCSSLSARESVPERMRELVGPT